MSLEMVGYAVIIGFVAIPMLVTSMEIARKKECLSIRSMYTRIKKKKIRLFRKKPKKKDPIDVAAENILKILNLGVNQIEKRVT